MASKKSVMKTQDNLDFNKLKEQDFLSSYIHDKPDIVNFYLHYGANQIVEFNLHSAYQV